MHTTNGKPTYVGLFLIGLIAVQTALTTAQGETVRKCLQCKPDANNDCLDQSKIQATDCTAGVTKCYTSNASGVITRGCYDEKNKPCEVSDNCKTCDSGEGCNKETICKTCQPSDNDCSQSNVNDAHFNGICKNSDTKCFMNVKDKKVERRCAADGDSCTDSTTCQLCTGVNCNAGIFPAQRRQCLQCTNCDTSEANKYSAKPCLNYVADDKCYANGTSAANMQRGCLSDVEPKPCEESDTACYICTTDSCNSAPYKRNAKISCIKCNTDADAECATERDAATADLCKEQLFYNQTESCYTLTKDSTVRRGCLFDDGKEDCAAKDACQVCSDKNGCNLQKVDIEFTCIVCRSDLKKECWNKAKTISGQGCRTGNSTKEEGCFHGIWNGISIRGCYIDADERMKVTCKDAKNKQCNMCYKKDCNTWDSGAGSIKVSFSLLLVIVTIFWYLN